MTVQNIVLIHGWAADDSIWEETKYFLKQRHQVYSLNLPGAQNRHSYCESVLEFIKQNKLSQVVIIGWSMGALVALQAAYHNLDIIKGLVLVSGTSRFLSDSQLSDGYPGGIPAVLITRMKKRLSKDYQQTINGFYELMFSAPEKDTGLAGKFITSHLQQGRTWELEEAQAGLDFLAEADLRAELTEISCPALLLHGDQDNICPLGGAEFIQQQMPRAQLISFPGVGHIPFLTHDEGFRRALEGWLASHDDK